MKVLKYLLPLWTSIAVYSVLSLFYGAMGFSAYNQLLTSRDIQWTNMQKLGAINTELENSQKNLLYDRDVVAIHAQSLGYGREDEQLIRIVGLGGLKNPHTSSGEILLTPTPAFIPDINIKIYALVVGLIALAILVLYNFVTRRR